MNPQLEGIEALPGTYLFDLERSAKGLHLNRFLHGLTVQENSGAEPVTEYQAEILRLLLIHFPSPAVPDVDVSVTVIVSM